MEETDENGVQSEVQPVQLPTEKLAIKPTHKIARGEKGHFAPGSCPNPAGRKKGQETTRTQIMKKLAENALVKNAPRFEQELKKLKGAQFVSAYLNLMDFIVPRLARVDGTQLQIHANREPQTIQIGEQTIVIN